METDQSTVKIESVGSRRILNSHLGFTNEFVIRLGDGGIGTGSSPQGETISVYEDRTTRLDTRGIIEEIRKQGLMDAALTQSSFDSFLEARRKTLGLNNCWALSLAFFNAAHSRASRFGPGHAEPAGTTFPRLCMNILNGGNHAYTNPILSDFQEYLVVPKFSDVPKMIRDHALIQQEVRAGLALCDRATVNRNAVHRLASNANREWIAFLQNVLDRLDLRSDYDLMIDASAGDLWDGKSYRLSITDGSVMTTDELEEYWMRLIDEFDIIFLEDPFAEKDFGGWKALSGGQSKTKVIGDNLYSSDAGRIEEGARNGYAHGAIIKPNQAGTVSAVTRAITTAHRTGQVAITSHRSISTESEFLPLLTVLGRVKYMKIGPLYTDYSSVIRFNELVRLTGVDLE